MATLNVARRFQYGDIDALGERLTGRPANVPGFAINDLQIKLYNRGYIRDKGEVDGIYDRNTESAHEAYERDNIDAGWKELIYPLLTPQDKEVFDAVQ